jgi:hypothetical protein
MELDGGRRRYRVLHHGSPIGSLRPARWWSDGTMRVGDRAWILTRTGRRYTARGPRSELSAERDRWALRWNVAGTGAPYHVEVARAAGRQWRVLRGDVEIGRSDIRGFWTPKAAVALPDDVPPADQLFLLWLMQDGIYRRSSRTSAASSGT